MITNNNKDNKGITMITKSLTSTSHHPRITKFGMLISWNILITSAKYQRITNNIKDNKGITMITKSLISTFHHPRITKIGMLVS